MAGGGSAYVRLEKPDNSISQGLQFWGQQAAQERQNNKLLKEREQIRQDEKEKEFDKNFGGLEEFKAKVTGFDTYDQIGADYTTKVRDEYVNEYHRASEALRTGNYQERKDAEMRMRTMKGTFAQIGDINTTLAKLNESYVKMAQEGKISGVDADNWEAQMESIIKDKNFTIELDKNGSPMIVGISKNEDGTESPFRIKYSDVVNGSWRPYERQDVGKIAKEVLGNLGSYKELQSKGLYDIKSQLWNDTIEKGAMGQISMYLNDEAIADILNQMDSKNKKKKDFTQEERNKVGERLLEIVRGGYKEEYEKKINDTRRGQDITAATARRGQDITAATARRGQDIGAATARRGQDITKSIADDRLASEKDKNKDLPDVKISSEFTVKEDGKNVTYQTYNLSDKNTGNKQPINIGVDKDGKAINIGSVDIDTKSGKFRYADGRGKVKTLSYEDDPSLYNDIYNQIVGRDVIYNTNVPSGNQKTNQKTPEELMQQYNF